MDGCMYDTEILERSEMMSVEAIISRQSLRWSGHLIRMDDTRILKQLFYSELSLGKRKRSKPKQSYKDTVKANLKKCDIPVENWEELSRNRSKWRKAIKVGLFGWYVGWAGLDPPPPFSISVVFVPLTPNLS